jgi:hypothetical protein
MKTDTYPLAMPEELLNEVRIVARETGLSLADAMRQSMKLGLPTLRQRLSRGPIKPMTRKEAKEAYAPDPEWDALEAAMTKRAVHTLPEED